MNTECRRVRLMLRAATFHNAPEISTTKECHHDFSQTNFIVQFCGCDRDYVRELRRGAATATRNQTFAPESEGERHADYRRDRHHDHLQSSAGEEPHDFCRRAG